ncbi:hypothetical protein N8755_04680 [Alphaproteobacteria bacterium]|nr:hypothetical protein [Alphaproteobacteria bacterium]
MKSLWLSFFLFSLAFWPLNYNVIGIPLYFLVTALGIFQIRYISKRMLSVFISVTVILLLHSIWVGTAEWYYTTAYLCIIYIITENLRSSSIAQVRIPSTSAYITGTHLILSYFSFFLTGDLLYIFDEPSHIGISIGPFFALTVISRKSVLSRIFFFLLMLMYAIHLPSMTFLICFISIFIYSLWFYLDNFLKVLLVAVIIALAYFSATGLYNNGIKEESLFIWGFGFIRAFDILQSNILGVGVFGWVITDLQVDFSDLTTFNDRDMASIIPFILSSFGVGSSIILAFLVGPQHHLSDNLKFFIFVVLTMSCVRWVGPSLGPFVLVVSLVFLNKQLKYSTEKSQVPKSG